MEEAGKLYNFFTFSSPATTFTNISREDPWGKSDPNKQEKRRNKLILIFRLTTYQQTWCSQCCFTNIRVKKIIDILSKLDGVGPVDNRQTGEMWHMTHSRWGKVNLVSQFQLPSSYGLGVKVFWRYFHKGWVTEWINKWMNDEGVCR